MSRCGASTASRCSGAVVFSSRHRRIEIGPGLVRFLRLQLVEAAVRLDAVAEVFEPAAAARAAGHLPADALGSAVDSRTKSLLNCCDVDEDPPALAVDHDAHEVDLRGGHVAARDVRVEDRPHEGGIAVGVQQVERVVAADVLIGVDGVERQVQRSLEAARHHAVRRIAAEADADVAIGLAVDGDRRRHVDVAAVVGLEQRLPVGRRKLDEDGAQHLDVVERLVGERLHVGRRQPLARAAACPAPAAAAAESAPRRTPAVGDAHRRVEARHRPAVAQRARARPRARQRHGDPPPAGRRRRRSTRAASTGMSSSIRSDKATSTAPSDR